MAFAQAEAGPSSAPSSPKAPKTKRVAELAGSGSEDESYLVDESPKSSPRGNKKKRKLDGKQKRAAEGDKDEERKKRRQIADELFEKRQELPFYQGRRMILEEIVKHDTTVVS
jgi:ATP-dependent RNA helicase DHX33